MDVLKTNLLVSSGVFHLVLLYSNFLVQLFLANYNFVFQKAKGSTALWVHRGWARACQQKVKRPETTHVQGTTEVCFLIPS